MVNRVFCYSKAIAKKNKNKFPILALILTTIFGTVGLIVLAISTWDNPWAFALFIVAWISLIVYYSIVLGLRMRSRMIGFATTNNGIIFKAMTVNNDQGLYFGGVAAGSMIDQLAGSSKNIGESLGGVVGAAAQFYAMNKSAQYMSHPEIIAKMVEEAPIITGAEVFEILKVYSVQNGNHSTKIRCDYKIIRTGKVKYNKKMTIEKSYNQFEDLMNTLLTHRVKNNRLIWSIIFYLIFLSIVLLYYSHRFSKHKFSLSCILCKKI